MYSCVFKELSYTWMLQELRIGGENCSKYGKYDLFTLNLVLSPRQKGKFL